LLLSPDKLFELLHHLLLFGFVAELVSLLMYSLVHSAAQLRMRLAENQNTSDYFSSLEM